MGASWLLLWGGGSGGAATTTTAAPAPPPPPPADAFEAACAAAARATGGPPTGTWSARMTLLRGSGDGGGVDAVAVSAGRVATGAAPAATTGPPPAPSLPAGPSTPATHVVWPTARRVLAGGPGFVPLLTKTAGLAARGRLEVAGPEFGAPGSAVVRVGRILSGQGAAASLRGVVLEIEATDVDDLAEAAPALAELTARLQSAAGGGGGRPGGSSIVAPLAVPVSEFDLPRAWGPAHAAVQLAALSAAVLGKGGG